MRSREGFVESNGHRLGYLAVNEHLLDQDERPVVVFIHGILASINFWNDCVPPVYQNNRAWYSLSLPAHHPSMVPSSFKPAQVNEQWFFEVMNGALKQLLGDRKAIIVGHSIGGFAALNLAINNAPNVAGVISVAGFHSGKWGGPGGLFVRLIGLGKWTRALFVSGLTLSRPSRFLRRLLASSLAFNARKFASDPLSQRMLDNVDINVSQQRYADLYPLFSRISRLEIAQQLNKITVPCHVFAGTHDPIITAPQSLLLSAEIPGATTTAFRNVGHMPCIEDAVRFYDALEHAVENIIDSSTMAEVTCLRDVCAQPKFAADEEQPTAHEAGN